MSMVRMTPDMLNGANGAALMDVLNSQLPDTICITNFEMMREHQTIAGYKLFVKYARKQPSRISASSYRLEPAQNPLTFTMQDNGGRLVDWFPMELILTKLRLLADAETDA